jgi:hypothetical protein
MTVAGDTAVSLGYRPGIYHRRRNPRRKPNARPNPRRKPNRRWKPNPRWKPKPPRRKPTFSTLAPSPTVCVTPRDLSPGRADAVSAEPAVAIVRAAKPIAILFIMMLIHCSEHPSLSEIKLGSS